MIIGVEIIGQPYSGEYEEVIYDVPCSNWKSAYWGWVKFVNHDYTEWCGEFRGVILGAEMSNRFNSMIILTTDCLFVLDKTSGKIIDSYEQPEYEQITLSPSEEYILASSYEIVVVKDSISDPINIEISKGVCSIKFLKWEAHQLILEFEDYIETGDLLNATLNTKTYEVILNNKS